MTSQRKEGERDRAWRAVVGAEVTLVCRQDVAGADLFGEQDQRRIRRVHREQPVVLHQGFDTWKMFAAQREDLERPERGAPMVTATL
jgi:hypothetical protein